MLPLEHEKSVARPEGKTEDRLIKWKAQINFLSLCNWDVLLVSESNRNDTFWRDFSLQVAEQ